MPRLSPRPAAPQGRSALATAFPARAGCCASRLVRACGRRGPAGDRCGSLGSMILVLFSGLRREEWRRAPSHCEWTVNGVPLHWFGFGYTALVVSGGIVGYVKTGRVPALAAGLLFGSLAGLGSYQLSQDPRNVWLFLAATSVTFVGVLGLRSYYYGKVMPVGLIAGASLLMAAKVGVRMLMTSD
ncbi:transmembrane protein 14B isoform X3 [Trachypithecus francoisi]|uniref:transmembrane protein 14B isoform X3 n=1 Tax=Trachypithecus francoisi TaxID=54180 RepID=UPI00141BDF81|nr:transmembrane protein 14B isoform X3 [Trachypithecus francoisi]